MQIYIPWYTTPGIVSLSHKARRTSHSSSGSLLYMNKPLSQAVVDASSSEPHHTSFQLPKKPKTQIDCGAKMGTPPNEGAAVFGPSRFVILHLGNLLPMLNESKTQYTDRASRDAETARETNTWRERKRGGTTGSGHRSVWRGMPNKPNKGWLLCDLGTSQWRKLGLGRKPGGRTGVPCLLWWVAGNIR